MAQAERNHPLTNRILQITVLAYQGIALIAFLVIPFLAINWLKTPFPGAFVEQTLIFNGVGEKTPPEAWDLFLDKSLALKYQLVKVNGVAVASDAQIRSALANSQPGDQIPITIRRLADNTEETRQIRLSAFPSQGRLVYFLVPYLIGLIFLASGLWIFGMRRTESAGRAFAIFATSVAIASGALFDLYTTHVLTFLWTFSVAIAGGALIDLALAFPMEIQWVKNHPYIRWIGYAAGLVLAISAAFTLYNFNHPSAYIPAWRNIYILAGLSVLFFAGMVVFRRVAAHSPVVRQQASTILLGMIVAFGPVAVWMLLTSLPQSLLPFLHLYNFSPYLLLFTIVFPIVMGYSIMRYRLLRTDFLLRQGVLYALLSILALGGYALLVSGLTLIFGQAFKATNPLFIGILVLILAFGLNPLRNWMQRFVDKVFFRGVQAYEHRIRDFSHEMTNTVDLKVIVRILRQHISNSLLPEHLHIYIFDPLNDYYAAAAGEDGRPTSDIRFTTSSPLVKLLGKSHVAIFADEESMPPELKPEQTRLTLLGAPLLVPLPGSDKPVGWLALGLRRSGENYAPQDLSFLDQISSAATVAIERAQVIFNLERRVREMNILARVSQGVNVTVAFDDILELIYAQTGQVLPVNDFHLTLYNKESDYFYFAFCLEKDDRLTYRENLPLYPNTDLSPQVIKSRRAILTSDYDHECQARGVTPLSQGIHSWAGVPLNTGAETIGSLSVGSRDPTVIYTTGQQELLQAIAASKGKPAP